MSVGRSALLTLCVALLVSTRAPLGAAGGNVVSFDVPVVVTDPCTGEIGTGTLDVLLAVNQNATNAGNAPVNVHASVHGELTGNRGSVYHISAEGTGQSSAASDLYEIPFHGRAIGDGSAPNIRVDGVAGVRVGPTGDPIDVSIISLSPKCGL